MSSFLIELWSNDTVPFKEISLCSSFVKSFDMLSKQKLYQLMLYFALNFVTISLLLLNFHYYCIVNLSKILYLLYQS